MAARTVKTKPAIGNTPPLLPGLLLFASGISALVFETLWVKQLALVVGVDVHAVTIAVSAFFAGLAFGGALFGRIADRVDRPLRLYALLELGVAVLGGLSTLALASSAPLFVRLQDSVGPLAWVLPFLLVGVPATLMGGTLPAALRAAGPGSSSVGSSTGLLYAANTAGAIVGTCLVPFVLVPGLGVRGAGLAAGVLCLAVATAAYGIGGRLPARPAPLVSGDVTPPRDASLALVLYAVAGAVALGYEVVWSELLVQFLSTRAHAFAVMLGTYLGGLAVGSWLFSRAVDRTSNPWRLFGLLIAGAGAVSLVTVASIGSWLPDLQVFAGKWAMRATGREGLEMAARFGVAAGVVLLLPTILLGGAFPAAARIAAGAARVGRGVGTLAAVNTAGGIAGTLLTGFLLIPRLGLVGTLGLLAAAGTLVGSIAIARGPGGSTASRLGAGALSLAVATLGLLVPRDTLGRLLEAKRGGSLVFYEEGTGGTVAVLEQKTVGKPFRRLYIQGVSNSGDAFPSLRYMRLQALLPLLVHRGEPRSALVVGLGTGITAGALLAYPSLETRVVAELLPAVLRAVPLFAGNLGAGSDARLEIRIGDGRHELLRRPDRYDLITLEPPPPSAAGVVNLYSRDFYELCRSRLRPGGLMAQWWPLPTQNDEDSQSLVRSFLDAFPYATAWSTELHEMLLVGSTSPIELDGRKIAARFSGDTASALAEVGVESPAALLATWVTGREGLEHYAGGAGAVTDDRPRIEHARWVRRSEIQRVLPHILGVASEVPVVGDERLRAEVGAERRALFAFYEASLKGYAGDRAAAAAALAESLEHDPANPYYRWVATGGR
jgi:spermidine synthase